MENTIIHWMAKGIYDEITTACMSMYRIGANGKDCKVFGAKKFEKKP